MAKTRSSTDDVVDLQRQNEELTKELWQNKSALREALEHQAATSEILRAISSSPTDLQRVVAEVAESAARLCDAYDAVICQADADVLHLVAHHGPIKASVQSASSRCVLVREFLIGRIVLERQTIQVADLQTEMMNTQRAGNMPDDLDTYPLGVPLIRAGEAIGVIAVRRTEVRRFTDDRLISPKTFADQAVIAIENTRLFEAEQARDA